MKPKIVTDPLEANVRDFCYRNQDNDSLPKGMHNWDIWHDVSSTGEWFVHTLGGQVWRLIRSVDLWERIE